MILHVAAANKSGGGATLHPREGYWDATPFTLFARLMIGFNL